MMPSRRRQSRREPPRLRADRADAELTPSDTPPRRRHDERRCRHAADAERAADDASAATPPRCAEPMSMMPPMMPRCRRQMR